MTRLFVIVAFLFAAGIATHAQAAPLLRSSVIVNDNVVRLGDIFDDAGDKSDAVVVAAPKVGREAIFDAAWLANVARLNGLTWQPAGNTDHVTIERAGIEIPQAQIEDALKAALAEKISGNGGSRKFQLAIDNRAAALFADPADHSDIQVRDLWVDKDLARFAATVAVGSDHAAQTVKISGKMFNVLSIPVLVHRVAAKDIIGPDDIRFIEVRSDQIDSDVVTDPDALIGMTPRRQVVENTPLRAGDLRSPIVIAKGTLVSMVVETPYMTLTAQGRAIEDGARGQAIRVMNTQSKMTVDAVVDGPSRVLVRAPLAPPSPNPQMSSQQMSLAR